jgi:hypothetical protein
MKKISIIIAYILLIGALFMSPHIYEIAQFNRGNMLKIVADYEVQSNNQGGLVKCFEVQDNEGNTYEVGTGFIAQWDKTEGDYINIKYVK